jgi:hypothetical protein
MTLNARCTSMIEATIKHFNVTLTSDFLEAAPFREEEARDIAKGLLGQFRGFGLTPSDVILREGDRLFDYDISLSLFNRNGAIRIGAQSVTVDFKNANCRNDAELMTDCIKRIFDCISERTASIHKLELGVHAALTSELERKCYLESLCKIPSKQPIGGYVFYFTDESKIQETRFLVDRSIGWKEALFFGCTLDFTSLDQLLAQAAPTFEGLVSRLGVRVILV